jgi:acylphosphatase
MNAGADRKAVRAVVHGRVQGVWFRNSTASRADALGVGGWVRNLPDGSVQVHAEGEPVAVDRLVAFLHDGPPRARVDGVRIEHVASEGHDEFKIGH